MPDVKISELPEFLSDPSGAYVPMINAAETTTYKILRENLIGDSGTSGTSGTSGADGTSGTSGISGSSGSSGTSGIDGSSGSSGTSGIDGSSGSSGTSGISGSSGSSGTSGISGSSGSSGTSGIDGSSGSSGTSGADGTSGTSGADGTNGTSGTSGTSGGGGGFSWPTKTLPGGVGISNTAAAWSSASNDKIFATRFYDTGTRSYDKLIVRVSTTVSSTSDEFNFAIYSLDGSTVYGLQPNVRLTEVLTLGADQTNTSGIKELTFSSSWTPPSAGVYALCWYVTNPTNVQPTANLTRIPIGAGQAHSTFISILYGWVENNLNLNYENSFVGPSSQLVNRYTTTPPLSATFDPATIGATAETGNANLQIGFVLD